ncbi:MAG: hypothetical protein M3O70_25295 [Actinomycetota bacterium]|nr:hypothetical protein [Actinomycetota bacterium]
MAGENVTGSKDRHYNLFSVGYRALHGAWNYEQYFSDAVREGDEELARFFRDVKQQHIEIAERAKELLVKRLAPTAFVASAPRRAALILAAHRPAPRAPA